MQDYRKKYKDHYGIEFGRDYVVHHIDKNRENNDISNLILLPNRLHSKFHCVIDGLQGQSMNLSDIKATPDSIRAMMWFESEWNAAYEIMSAMQPWIDEKEKADGPDGEYAYLLFKQVN